MDVGVKDCVGVSVGADVDVEDGVARGVVGVGVEAAGVPPHALDIKPRTMSINQ